MAFAELWWRSRLRHALRRLFLPRRKLRGAAADDDTIAHGIAQRSSLAQRAAAIAVGTMLALVGAELLLRVPGVPIPRDLSTYLFQCYFPEYEPAKIRFWSGPLAIHLHKPDFETTCGWNGYHWNHHSDAWGGRNPETWSQADVALLGDSMIYGHGVEEDQSTAHFLRERLGVKVTNLGAMGDSFPQYLARLRNFALPLRPRVVFVFAFGGNDISDIIHERNPKMMQEFIDHGSAPEARVFPREALLNGPRPASASIARAIEHQALVYRTFRFFLLKSEKERMPVTPPTPDVSEQFPSPTGPPPTDLRQEERLALSYLEAVLELMRDSARDVGTELVVVYLPGLSQAGAREDRLVFHHVRGFATELGLRFLDASPVQYQDGHPVPGARLDYDGHLSEAGHRRLATLLVDYVERNGLLTRHAE